jgi:hypothetical protein
VINIVLFLISCAGYFKIITKWKSGFSLKDNQAIFLSDAMQTDYGLMAIIKDPDGRKIELYDGAEKL